MNENYSFENVVSNLKELFNGEHVPEVQKNALHIGAVALYFIEERHKESFLKYLISFNDPLSDEQLEYLRKLGIDEAE